MSAPVLPPIEVRSVRLADLKQEVADPIPVRLRISAAGVDAPIVPVGVVGHSSRMQIPSDVNVVGWYRFGPSPGGAGSAVLVGHVDSSAQGSGAFFHLQALQPGSIVAVRYADGRDASFRVVGRRTYQKNDLPSRLFVRSGSPVLTLITCGGPFNPVTRHYEDNVVVFAVPVH
jgi:hypothetical protein